ncbi:MAG: sensor histidine kinase KdpD [Bdellovibrionaceae bacterium]|nr:sensor histidine kinase KdpD [Pseudobdellovibrionaceae bacterium]
MIDDERPDPDELLKAVKAEESAPNRGRLRLFLGMSAGVGKTYAMLKAAHARQAEGRDVLVGVIETHGRCETAALLEGLKILPRRQVDYKDTKLDEMDLDAILSLRPSLVLVDELAHSNVPGSRHPKRYQDVLEILDQGIDVYSTLNIQHLESRKESVEAIAQISIRETVPDSILDRASQVELVDIAPSELLKRLREGKVYLGDKAQRAADHFFKEDRLTALREIALRLTAERVDQDLQRFGDMRVGKSPWQTNERLLVAISHSPHSESLIRTTRRLAYNLEAPWIAVHVETGLPLNDADQAQLSRNIQLARELGAEIVTTSDLNLAGALRRIARQKNVTQMVVGRPIRRFFRDHFYGGTLLDRMVRETPDIDVHVIRHRSARLPLNWWKRGLPGFTGPLPYWNTFWFLAGVAFLSAMVEPVMGYRAVAFFFLLGVLTVGMVSTMGPVLFAAVLSALGWNFFFIPPRLTFAISTPEDAFMSLAFVLVAAIVGILTNRIRGHERMLREREERTNTLYEISQDLAASRDQKESLIKINERLGRLLDGDVGVFLRGDDGRLERGAGAAHAILISDKEFAVAEWAINAGRKAGWSTDTLAQADSLFLPMQGSQFPVGILAFRPRRRRALSLEQENLLYAIARQLAVALEKTYFEEKVRETRQLEESEKLHQTLLSSISHELRTPLTVVMGAATALHDENRPKDDAYVKGLAGELIGASDRLNRVIENLLDMTRLNSGRLAPKLEWEDLRDLFGVVQQKLAPQLKTRHVRTEVPDDLPLVRIDFRLLEHALSNLVMNALLYTPPTGEIVLRAGVSAGRLQISVRDHGPGIPEASLPHLFDKFYRVPGTPAGGTGLGLSIVRGIVEAHQGTVHVKNAADGGAIFWMDLPTGGNQPASERS